MSPIDYLSAMPQQDFLKDIQGGFQLGAGIQQIQQQRQQQAMAAQQEAEYQVDYKNAIASNTPQAWAALALKNPAKREAIKQSWEMQSEGERKDQGDAMSQTYSAMLANRPDIAEKVLTKRIEARKNSGMDVSQEENILDIVKNNPQQALGVLGHTLSNIYDPKTFSGFATLGGEQRAMKMDPAKQAQAKADAAKAASDAEIAAVTAKHADSKAIQDMAKTDWDIRAVVNDIDFKKESNRIAAMNAAFNKESNQLKREELRLKIEDAKTARDEKVRTKVSEAESGAAAMDNMLNTVERILKNPSLNNVVGSIEGTMPAVISDEAADAIALIDQLGSQAFISQIPNIKGMGSLSNAEGDKLQSSLQNLGRRQSEKQFRESAQEVMRLVKKGRETLSKRTGVPLGAPDTPAAPKVTAPYAAPSTAAPASRNVTVDY